MNKQQIIYVDNKPHIKCNVVMLPSKEDTRNSSQLYQHSENKRLVAGFMNSRSTKDIPVDIYITSNEKIKKDDWSYNDILKEIVQNNCSSNRLVSINANEHNHKIIATTDISLTIKGEQEGENTWYNPLPQLSQQFIEKYIEEYNKANQIVDVLVEITDSYLEVDYTSKLKLDSQNQITIRKQKDNWNREELIKSLNNCIEKICSQFNYNTRKSIRVLRDEWIEENL